MMRKNKHAFSVRELQFKLVDPAGLQPELKRLQDVAFADWRGRGADAMVIGTVEPGASGKLQVRFHLLDVAKQANLTSLMWAPKR